LETIDAYRKLGFELYNVYSMRDDIILELNKYTNEHPTFESEIDLVDARCRGKKNPLHWQFYIKCGHAEIYLYLYEKNKYVDKMEELKTSLVTRRKFVNDNDYFEISRDVSDVYLTGELKIFIDTLINEIDFTTNIFS
jgi:hypothetical protein